MPNTTEFHDLVHVFTFQPLNWETKNCLIPHIQSSTVGQQKENEKKIFLFLLFIWKKGLFFFFDGRTLMKTFGVSPQTCAIVRMQEEAFSFQSGAVCFLFLTAAQEFLESYPEPGVFHLFVVGNENTASIPAAPTTPRLLMSWGFATSKCWVVCSRALLICGRQELRCEV